MKLSHRVLELGTRDPFNIAREEESGEVFRNVCVRLEHEGFTGWGEAAPSVFYGEDSGTVAAALEVFAPVLDREPDPWKAESLMAKLDRLLGGNFSAKAAIDMALYDLQGKLCEKPLFSLLGLDPDQAPLSSFTIGMDEPGSFKRKIQRVAAYPLLKIKLGGERDLELMQIVRRKAPKAVVRVDANAAWDPHQALHMIRELEKYDIEFVEQPLHPADTEGMKWLRQHSSLPLVADESCRRLEDLPSLAGLFDGINIKLCKCGGIRHALKMIHCARALGLKIMLGCMIESSVGITAAGQISPLVDYADLDGAALLADDPFQGMAFEKCRLLLPRSPGLGIAPVA